MQSADIIHIAAHCKPGTETSDGALAIFQRQGTKARSRKYTTKGFINSSMRAQLLMVPDCSSGVGENDFSPSQGSSIVLGGLAAGVNTVIGSVYPTYSIANILIIARFYTLYLTSSLSRMPSKY